MCVCFGQDLSLSLSLSSSPASTRNLQSILEIRLLVLTTLKSKSPLLLTSLNSKSPKYTLVLFTRAHYPQIVIPFRPDSNTSSSTHSRTHNHIRTPTFSHGKDAHMGFPQSSHFRVWHLAACHHPYHRHNPSKTLCRSHTHPQAPPYQARAHTVSTQTFRSANIVEHSANIFVPRTSSNIVEHRRTSSNISIEWSRMRSCVCVVGQGFLVRVAAVACAFVRMCCWTGFSCIGC